MIRNARTHAVVACRASAAAAAVAMSACGQPERAAPSTEPSHKGLAALRPHEFIAAGEPVVTLLGVTERWPGATLAPTTTTDGQALGDAALDVLRLAPPSAPGAWAGAWPSWELIEASPTPIPAGATALATTPAVPEEVTQIAVGGAPIRMAPATAPPLSARPARPPALDRLANDIADPLRWWRLELLAVDAPFKGPEPARRLAAQVRNQWREALARLRATDTALADAVERSLARTVIAPGDIVIPAWSTNAPRLSRLLDGLSIAVADAQIAPVAESWLVDEPSAAAWIIDDGAGGRTARIGVANFTADAVAASASLSGRVEMVVLDGETVGELRIPAPAEHTGTVEVLIGPRRFDLPIDATPWNAKPPGVRMGPLVPEWSLPTWLGEQPVRVEPAWAAAANLERSANPAGEPERWDLYIECRAPAAVAGADVVTIRIGDPSSPRITITADRDRGVIAQPAFDDRARPPTTTREPDRWTAFIPLPPQWTSEDGLLISLERTDARGVRSTWPRASTPWQDAPPCVLINLSAWDGGARE